MIASLYIDIRKGKSIENQACLVGKPISPIFFFIKPLR
jgi:hypothetical protein